MELSVKTLGSISSTRKKATYYNLNVSPKKFLCRKLNPQIHMLMVFRDGTLGHK